MSQLKAVEDQEKEFYADTSAANFIEEKGDHDQSSAPPSNDLYAISETESNHEQIVINNDKEVGETYIVELKKKFKATYESMDRSKMWQLKSGRFVEDELYCFGMQCTMKHQAHSFIVDISDRNLQNLNVFSQEEVEEIDQYKRMPTPSMPKTLCDYLNSFNKSNTDDLRKQIFQPMNFDQNYNKDTDFDFDWIRNSCYNFLLEYEAECFKIKHHEEWYKAHVWNFNDTCFNQTTIDVARGEISSSASSKRKNSDRCIDAIEGIVRKRMGSRCDMIFRELHNHTEEVMEYGASESGSTYEGEQGSKLLREGYLKLPKTLKDMLDQLLYLYPEVNKDSIETVGYVHSGLFSQVLRVDRPVTYTTRVRRMAPTPISSNVAHFGSSVLSALYASFVVREIVKRVQNACSQPKFSTNDSSWLQHCLELKHSTNEHKAPQTSTSDQTNKRQKRS